MECIFVLFILFVGGIGCISFGDTKTGCMCIGFVIFIIIAVVCFSKDKTLKDIKNDRKIEKDKKEWNSVFQNSSFVQELVEMINSQFIRVIEIYQSQIILDDKIIKFSERDMPNLTTVECGYLATNIKNGLKYGKVYSIEEINIGSREEVIRNLVDDYSYFGHDEILLGYKLYVVAKEKNNKLNDNQRKESWSK